MPSKALATFVLLIAFAFISLEDVGTSLALETITWPDNDGDGCADLEEVGPTPAEGGLRDPANKWDFYDVTGDGEVDMRDVSLVAYRWGAQSGQLLYDAQADRSPPPAGGTTWDIGPPDGTIGMYDVMAVLAQFGHSCIGATKITMEELTQQCGGNVKETTDPLNVGLYSGDSYSECRVARDETGIPIDAIVVEADMDIFQVDGGPSDDPFGGSAAGSGVKLGSCTGHNRARHFAFGYTMYDLWLKVKSGAITDPNQLYYTVLWDRGTEWGNTARYPFSWNNKVSTSPPPGEPPTWTNWPWEFHRTRWGDLKQTIGGIQWFQDTLLTGVRALWANDIQSYIPDGPEGAGPICYIWYQG